MAVRIGFDDNHTLGKKETGGLTALPISREIMLRVYNDCLAGPTPRFPREMENRIDRYLAMLEVPATLPVEPPAVGSTPVETPVVDSKVTPIGR